MNSKSLKNVDTKIPVYVVVFIPALNEEEKIGDVVKNTYGLFKGSEERGFWVDVIVVDDGSKDKTGEVSRKAGAKLVVRHPYNRGLGAATRSGMQEAYRMGADIAVKIDADYQWDPQDIEKVMNSQKPSVKIIKKIKPLINWKGK